MAKGNLESGRLVCQALSRRRALGTGSLSPRYSMKGKWREGSYTGDPEKYVKALEMGFCFHRAPLLGNMEGCSFLRAFENRKKKNLIERNCYEGFERDAKMPCKQVSLSIGSLLGNTEGVSLPGLFERGKKKYVWFPFLDPEDPSDPTLIYTPPKAMKDNTLKTSVLVSQLWILVQNQTHILLEKHVVLVVQLLVTSSTSVLSCSGRNT
jgi:hypothetical protein